MKNLIKNYAKKMTKNDIINFANKKNYHLEEKEIDIIYNHIKKYTDEIIEEPIKYAKMLKGKISDNIYYEILTLIEEYKNYLK